MPEGKPDVLDRESKSRWHRAFVKDTKETEKAEEFFFFFFLTFFAEVLLDEILLLCEML